MTPLCRLGSTDLSDFILFGDRSHDFGQPQSPQFGGNTAFNDGQPWVRTSAQNREWSFPLLLQPRPAIAQYTNLITNPSFEVDTSGWATSGAGVNLSAGATLTRVTTTAAVASASGQVVTTSASASQGAGFALGAFYAGQTYQASVYVKGNAGSEALTIVLGDTGVANSSTTTNFSASTTWTLVTISFTPTVDVAAPSLDVRTQSAVAVTFFIDGALVVQAGALPGYFDGSLAGCAWTGTAHASTSTSPTGLVNYITNPSLETGTSGWLSTGGGTLSQDSTYAAEGSNALKIVAGGVGANEGGTTASAAVAASQTYTASVWVRGAKGGEALQLVISERDAADTAISTTTTNFTAAAGWRRVVATRAFGTTGVNLRILIRTQSTEAATFYVDGALAIQASSDRDYFDGDSLDAYWTGAAHGSSSVAYTGTDGLHLMLQKLNGLLYQGQHLQFKPEGASSISYFDVEEGFTDPHWDIYEDTAGVVRCGLKLFTRPYATTGTTALVASAQGTGMMQFGAQVGGDLDALGAVEFSLASYNPQTLFVGGFGIARSASYIAEHPAASLSPQHIAASPLAGASGAIASQYRAITPTVGGAALRMVDYFNPVGAYLGQRMRAFAIYQHRVVPASCLVFSVLAENSGDGIVSPALGSYIATSAATAGWVMADLGELNLPAGASGRAALASAYLQLSYSIASPGSVVASPAVRLSAIQYLPIDPAAGLIVRSGVILTTATPVNRMRWEADQAANNIYRGNASIAADDLTQYARGGGPRVPATPSSAPSGAPRFVAFIQDAVDVRGNNPITVSLSARSRFNYLR